MNTSTLDVYSDKHWTKCCIDTKGKNKDDNNDDEPPRKKAKLSKKLHHRECNYCGHILYRKLCVQVNHLNECKKYDGLKFNLDGSYMPVFSFQNVV